MNHIDEQTEAYLGLLAAAEREDPLLDEMEDRARKEDFPIIGRLVGRFIELQARAIGARKVIELGSGYGYSAYWFARAVGPEGEVVCTEESPELIADAETYLRRAELWDRVRYHEGDGIELLRGSDGPFDVVYVDTHKFQYPEAWRLARDRIRVGGLYLCDNVLWRGMVPSGADDDVFPGWPDAIREHNRMVTEDPDYVASLNPVRDGVLAALRIS